MDAIEFTKEYRTKEKLDAAVELLQRNGISVKLNGSQLCVSSAKIELATELLAGEGYMFNSICYTQARWQCSHDHFRRILPLRRRYQLP